MTDVAQGDVLVLVDHQGRCRRYRVADVRHRVSTDGSPFALVRYAGADRVDEVLLLVPGLHIRRASKACGYG